MKEGIECGSCGTPLSVHELLDASNGSSTAASAVRMICPYCAKENQFVLYGDKVATQSQFLAGGGVVCAGLNAKPYANFLHVWYHGRHWAIRDIQVEPLA